MFGNDIVDVNLCLENPKAITSKEGKVLTKLDSIRDYGTRGQERESYQNIHRSGTKHVTRFAPVQDVPLWTPILVNGVITLNRDWEP